MGRETLRKSGAPRWRCVTRRTVCRQAETFDCSSSLASSERGSSGLPGAPQTTRAVRPLIWLDEGRLFSIVCYRFGGAVSSATLPPSSARCLVGCLGFLFLSVGALAFMPGMNICVRRYCALRRPGMVQGGNEFPSRANNFPLYRQR